MKRAALALLLVLTGCSSIEIISKPSRRGSVTPEVSSTLLELIDRQEEGAITASDYDATSLGVILRLGTPAGLRLQLRYRELGVSLVEALKLSRDQDLLVRLIELAKWSDRRSVRSEALVTVAAFADPADLSHFRAALIDQDVGIRFAAVEALQKWGGDEALPLLSEAAADKWSALIRVFAAQAALSLGDKTAIGALYAALQDRSWIVRAMAARYLGDYAPADDYPILLKVVSQESRNDFVAAEAAIATLKLLARKSDSPVPAPERRPAPGSEGRYRVSSDDVVEMEPLVIRPPRLHIPESVRIAQSINNRLVQLIQSRLDVPMDPQLASDPNLQDLNKMATPEGLALQIRYGTLSVAVAEGLAGTTDAILRSQLTHLAESSRNSLTRATALLSLAYARDDRDIPLLTRALRSEDEIVRFGAIEAIQAGRFREATGDLVGVASSDNVPIFRLYAIQVMLELGEPAARNMLLGHDTDDDWPSRAMTFWLLGRYGESADHGFVVSRFTSETNSFVLAELALAAQRLAP
jgi:HEAT repeat protein